MSTTVGWLSTSGATINDTEPPIPIPLPFAAAIDVNVWLTVSAIASTIVNGYGVYAIVRLTPVSLRNFRTGILINHIIRWTMDIAVSFFFRMQLLLPLFAVKCAGIFTQVFGFSTFIQFLLLDILLILNIIVVSQLFFERHQQLLSPTSAWKLPTKTFHILTSVYHGIICILTFIPLFLSYRSQQDAKSPLMNLAMYTDFSRYIWQAQIYNFDTASNAYLKISLINHLGCLSIHIMLCICICLHGLHTMQTRKNVSSKTKVLEMRMFRALIVMLIAPVAMLFLPIIVCVEVHLTMMWYVQDLSNILVFIFSLHGCAATIAMIMVTESYRAETVALFLHLLGRNVNRTVSSNSVALPASRPTARSAQTSIA